MWSVFYLYVLPLILCLFTGVPLIGAVCPFLNVIFALLGILRLILKNFNL